MGFYLRKTFKLGPINLNLSKSGLGGSVGVRGLRVGSDARGRRYLAAGRRGFYFRQYSGGATRPPAGRVWAIIVAVLLLLLWVWA